MIVFLTAGVSLMSRALVREQFSAEAAIVAGVPLSDDFSYHYNLSEMRDDYVVQMSEAFQIIMKLCNSIHFDK